MISVYKKRINNNITLRDYDVMARYIKLIQWGRKNPVQFIELVLGIPLMDFQRWLISMSWTKEYIVWTCSRNTGKSFLLGCFIMARTLLFPKIQVQICASNWNTVNDTHSVLEKIAKNNIKTLISDNSVFMDELYKTKADSDGFTHDYKKGNNCTLLNGSSVQATNALSKSARGKRANMLVFDESGQIPNEAYGIVEPYISSNADFKLGGSFDSEVYPEDIPNTRIYAGSASDTNSLFYEKYKEGIKQMLAGNEKYFVADISCEVPLHPTRNGIDVKALLSQTEIDRKMKENEIIAMREYYNIFDHFDLEDSVVTRSDIMANTDVYLPSTSWGGKKHKYVISYDPASKNDNAPILVMDLYKDDETNEWCGRCAHMENLIVRYADGSKRPMRIDEQIQRLREIIYDYNGKENSAPYENVTVLLDAGAGGQGLAIAQELTKDWEDSHNHKHFGIYDENNEFSKRWAETYPHAISGCLKLIEPRKYRNDLFVAAKTLVPMGVIRFSPQCPKFDTLVLDDGTERKLGKNELASLVQMDLMKEEIVSMVRTKSASTGYITYQLPPEKRNKMHDDRAYVFVLCCWWVFQIRSDDTFGDSPSLDYSCITKKDLDIPKEMNKVDDPWLSGLKQSSGSNKKISPFSGESPFKNK